MWQRTTCIGLVLATAAGLSLAPAASRAPAREKEPSLSELSLEVAALQLLHAFKFTPAQMDKLQKLARETVEKPRQRKPGKGSVDFRAALVALREALAEDSDDDDIDKLEEQLDDLRDAEKPDLEDGVDLTAAARKRAPEVLRLLSARQVASFIADNADEVQDPLERLVEALALARKKKARDWREYRTEVAEEIARLVAGLTGDKPAQVGQRVSALLTRARGLTEEEFKKQQPALAREARQVAGGVSPMAVLRHIAEYALAELLSNPRLVVALKARSK
jgi:hypothetical protein